MYILGIDETGTTSNFKKRIDRIKIKGKALDQGEANFILVLIKMEEINYVNFKNDISKLKIKYKIPNNLELHAIDIFGNKHEFKKIFTTKKMFLNFLNDLKNILETNNFRFYYSTVDVEKHILKYSDPWDPYQLSIEYILERVMQDVGDKEYKIFIEGRGYKEDLESQKTILTELITNNNLNKKNININFVNKKQQNYSNIVELADFIAYLLRQYEIKMSNSFSKFGESIFSQTWIQKILYEQKMKYNKIGYDIKKIP